jgi:hypothetical protein
MLKTICSVFLLLFSFNLALAQQSPTVTQASETPVVTAGSSGERVRFAAPGNVVQMHLQVYADTAQIVFDASSKGNVLDWSIQDGSGERLRPGAYLCLVTVKNLSGKLGQSFGQLIVQEQQIDLRTIDPTALTAAQQQEIGPLEPDSPICVLKQDDAAAATVIAHDGQDGQITRAQGALSFRIGDFFSGKTTEQMRLTPEGNVGIGITHPQARLDVDGMIRASQGITFPDGSIQYSASRKTFGEPSSGPDGKRENSKAGKEHIDPQATGAGTAGMLAMWTDNAGTLGDSVVTQSNGFIGIGTTTPPAPFTVDSSANTLPAGSGSLFIQGNVNKERIEMRSASNSLVGPALQGRGYSGTIASPAATQVGGNLMTIAGSGHNGNPGESGIVTLNAATIKMKAEENWTPSANGAFISFETTPPGSSTASRTERMRISGAGNVGIGTNNPLSLLHVKGASPVRILGDLTTLSGSESVDFMARNSPFSSDIGGMRIQRQPATGDVDTLFLAAASGNSAAEKMRIRGNGNVGVGTAGPSFRLHVVDSGSTGLRVQTNSPGGTVASFGVNGDFQVDAVNVPGGRLIVKENGNVGIGITSPAAKLTSVGLDNSNINGTGQTGMSGHGGNALGSGGSTGNIGGVGVMGTGGNAPGSDGVGGVGLMGTGGNAEGNFGGGGAGVVGIAGEGFELDGDGIIGMHVATSGNAGSFFGDVGISGNLSVNGNKNFKIDHPLDPENKYLIHAAIESSEVLNIYSGNVTTDDNGSAVVVLPAWFEAVNKDFRYQLTVVNIFAQAIVAEKIKGKRFVIKTNVPGVEVSWQVTGVRSDARMLKHPFNVEEAKPEIERGTYLSPESFGKPEEKGIMWARHPELMRQLKERREQAQEAMPRTPNP